MILSETWINGLRMWNIMLKIFGIGSHSTCKWFKKIIFIFKEIDVKLAFLSLLLKIMWLCFNSLRPLDSVKHQVLDPLSESVKCFYEKYSAELSKYYDENLRYFWEVCIHHAIDFVREYCPQDSVLVEMADALEKMEVKRMKTILSNRYREMKGSVSQCLRGKCIIWRTTSKLRIFKIALYA